MKISSTIISDEVRNLWPNIYLPWLTDREYIAPTIAEVMEAVERCSVASLKTIDNISECEDFAEILAARIKEERIEKAQANLLKQEELFNWAFGFAFGDKFRAWDEYHYLNIFRSEEGLRLLEPQTHNFWQPTSADDNVIVLKI
ncbi:MAG: hypothetical protein ACXACB_01995 [Promethearchaeota archaeon]|jgi:hypothetical protein